MKLILITMICALFLVSCGRQSNGGSNVGGDPVDVTEFTSPQDPCLEATCTDERAITYSQAYSILQQGDLEPEKGLQITNKIIEDDTYFIWDDSLDAAKEVQCRIYYTQTRTLADFNANYIWIEEINSQFDYLPKTDDCRKVVQDEGYFDREVIAKEDRPDAALGSGSEILNKLFFKLLKINGETVMRISGTMKGVYEVETQKGVKFTTSLDSIFRLGTNFFTSSYFHHNLSKTEGYSEYENLERNLSFTSGVDVSHIDITTLDECEDVDNRTDDPSVCSSDADDKIIKKKSILNI